MGLFGLTDSERQEIEDIKSGQAQVKGRAEGLARQQQEAANAAYRKKMADERGARFDAEMARNADMSKERERFKDHPDVLAILDSANKPSPILTAIGGAVGKAKDALFPPKPMPVPAPQPIDPNEVAKKKSPIMGMLASR